MGTDAEEGWNFGTGFLCPRNFPSSNMLNISAMPDILSPIPLNETTSYLFERRALFPLRIHGSVLRFRIRSRVTCFQFRSLQDYFPSDFSDGSHVRISRCPLM